MRDVVIKRLIIGWHKRGPVMRQKPSFMNAVSVVKGGENIVKWQILQEKL